MQYFIVTKKPGETGFKTLMPSELRELALSKAPIVGCLDDFYAADEAAIIICGEVVVPQVSVCVKTGDGTFTL